MLKRLHDEETRVPSWLADYLGTLGVACDVPLEIRYGSQSACYIFNCARSQAKIAAKVFRDPAATSLASQEYAALQTLHDALNEQQCAEAPEPIGLIPSRLGAGYVMSAVDGMPLTEFLRGKDSFTIAEIAKVVSWAVACYHAAAERPYGDFHPSNILIAGHERSIVLIDPTCPSPRHLSVEESLLLKLAERPLLNRLMAIDVGYWLYSVVSRTVRGDFRSISEIRGQMEFAMRLADSVDAESGVLLSAKAALEHLRFPRPNRSIQARMMGVLTGVALRTTAVYAKFFPSTRSTARH